MGTWSNQRIIKSFSIASPTTVIDTFCSTGFASFNVTHRINTQVFFQKIRRHKHLNIKRVQFHCFHLDILCERSSGGTGSETEHHTLCNNCWLDISGEFEFLLNLVSTFGISVNFIVEQFRHQFIHKHLSRTGGHFKKNVTQFNFRLVTFYCISGQKRE